MAIRINNNIASVRGQRYMSATDKKLADSLERLSSGFRINKGGDDPAGLIISEQMRAQIKSVNQAAANTEIANAMVQTTEGALAEINDQLVRIRQLALHASNEGANDANMLAADQMEIRNALESLQRTTQTARFGGKKLLDGSTGINGTATGEGLTFVKGAITTRSTPVEGYRVDVTQVATQAQIEGSQAVTTENLKGLSIDIMEGGHVAHVEAKSDDSVERFLGRLKGEVEKQGMKVDITITQDNRIKLTHQEYGSVPTFSVVSSAAGVLSPEANKAVEATQGLDIRGTINGEAAYGRGQTLIGGEGNPNTDGLSVMYTGPMVEKPVEGNPGQMEKVHQPMVGTVGTVHVINSALTFQTGGQPGENTRLALPNITPSTLGRNIETETGVKSLAEVDVTTVEGAHDTVKVVDSAINEISLARGELGSIQRNNLEINLAVMRVASENLVAAESAIRDTDMAKEIAEFTKNRIQLDANVASLSHANHYPSRVVQLLD
ncbi:MAG: flagellin [Deltaproteobacteria bacterium]|nr:flagellin [Deltaproteobacteria bacterium]